MRSNVCINKWNYIHGHVTLCYIGWDITFCYVCYICFWFPYFILHILCYIFLLCYIVLGFWFLCFNTRTSSLSPCRTSTLTAGETIAVVVETRRLLAFQLWPVISNNAMFNDKICLITINHNVMFNNDCSVMVNDFCSVMVNDCCSVVIDKQPQ